MNITRPNRTRHNAWPDEDYARLRALWTEGHSTAEIGRRMDRSKNSIAGKAHRLDLPSRPSPIQRGDYVPPPRGDRVRSTAPRVRRVVIRPTGPTLPVMASEMPDPLPPPIEVAQALPDPPVAPPSPFSDHVYRLPTPVASMPIASARTCQSPLWGDTERPTHVYCGDPAEIGSYCKSCASRYFTRSWRGEGKREFTFGWPAGERRVGAET